MGAIHHFVSRGVELAYQQAGSGEEFKLDVPAWVPVLLAGTTALYVFLHLAITYTFGILVPTLTALEAPSATAIIRTERYSDDESPDAPLLSKEEKENMKPRVDEEVLLVANKPLTAKFKTIIRHLREQTGSKHSHWRGVGGFLIYNIATMWALGFARSALPFRCAHLLHIPGAGILCLLSTAWIQQMVAMPGKNYFQRVSELARAGAFKKLIVPVICVELLETAVVMLPRQFAIILGIHKFGKADDESNVALLAFGSAVVLFTVIPFILAVIPANIGLVRFQASLLSEETETVIPMDRTLGDAEKKSVKTGWKSFSRDGLRRLVRNYVMYGLLQMAVTMWFVISVSVQLYVAFGSQAPEVIKKHAEKARMML